MELNSLRNDRISASMRGHQHFSFGGATVPENVTIRQHYNITSTKKSNLRLNDQLIPKPTDIEMGKIMIQVAVPKEHPYSSHISRFAVFPSLHSPDDPLTGVRAASQAKPPNLQVSKHLIPYGALQVRVSSKTMGAPYRQEILDFQKTSNKGMVWIGEHGLDHNKPVKAKGQVFYPTPPKTVLPKLRDSELSLSERTANMLKNVERLHWISSYQLQYTGSGPANPLKMDDFNEKILGSTTGGVTSDNAPLRERSQPTFVPTKPRVGRMARRRQACLGLKTTLQPTVESEYLDQSRSLIPAPACILSIDPTASIYDNEPQEITAKTVSPRVAVCGRNQTEWIATKTGPALLSQELLNGKQSGGEMPVSQPENKEAQCETGENEMVTFMYDESHTEANRREKSTIHATQGENTDKGCSKALWSRTLLSQEEPEISNEETVNDVLIQSTKKHDYNFESNQHIQNQSPFAKKPACVVSMSGGEWSRAHPAQQQNAPVSILPRSKVPFNMQQVVHERTPFSQRLPSLLDLQESFSKSEVHRRFNDSITLAPVDLRDSVGVGKKHKFHGINCYYLHG